MLSSRSTNANTVLLIYSALLVANALGAYSLAPESATMLLRTYVPDLQVFAQQLANENVPPSAIAGLVHRQ